MKIQIIATSVETKPTAKGSYQLLEVTYKNLSYQGKTESQKILSFTPGTAFKTLSDAQPGSVWEVVKIKNAKGYIEWSSAEPSSNTPDSGPIQAGSDSFPTKSQGTMRSNYETPEERAQRQVYIIRQSSLSAAISTLSVGAKAVKSDDVINLAQEYVDFVLNGVKADPGPSGFEDLPDFDIPEVK